MASAPSATAPATAPPGLAPAVAPAPSGSPTPVSTRPTPPHPTGKYTHAQALDDLPRVQHAIELFLASHMVECEDYCNAADPKRERLYMATGYGLLQAIKSMMSFEDEDLLAAIEHCKHGLAVAAAHRKRPASMASRLAGFVTGSSSASGLTWIKSMSPVERHAELVYAETLFEKALLGILYSGDWLAFLKEALNLRATMNIYRDLGRFVAAADAAHPSKHDPALDAHFRSGVCMGVGTSALVMSMMPPRVASVVELLGYKGDRREGLAMLARPGGWSVDADEPAVGIADEGCRRSVCDIVLLIFHLVLSGFTFAGVDIALAEKMLRWNLKRYPDGVIFLFGLGRLHYKRSQPAAALAAHERALRAQDQYKNLHHVSYWEIAIAHLALLDVAASLRFWRRLEAEATWSKAVYTYGAAVCLLDCPDAPDDGPAERAARQTEAAELLARVPELKQRIAGKSIPMEKFVARRARRHAARPLVLPALELGYVFGAVQHAPRSVLLARMLPAARAAAAALGDAPPAAHAKDAKSKVAPAGKKAAAAAAAAASAEKDAGSWADDRALARFLEGTCWRFAAFPDPDAAPEDPAAPAVSTHGVADVDAVVAAAHAQQAFEEVFALGAQIELDHHLVYHAHYELGRLLAARGDAAGARAQFGMVLSGRPLEVPAAARKQGKYSMENALMMRTSAALEALENGQQPQ